MTSGSAQTQGLTLQGRHQGLDKAATFLAIFLRLLTILFVCMLIYDHDGSLLYRTVGTRLPHGPLCCLSFRA